MINVVLNADDICHSCPYFQCSTDQMTGTSIDGDIHFIYVSCEHKELCDHLKKFIEKENKK